MPTLLEQERLRGANVNDPKRFERVERPGRGLKAPKTDLTERFCASKECDTRLSRYNKRKHCFAHQPYMRPRLRGRATLDPEVIGQSDLDLPVCRNCSQRRRRWVDLIGERVEVISNKIRHREGTVTALLCTDPAKRRITPVASDLEQDQAI